MNTSNLAALVIPMALLSCSSSKGLEDFVDEETFNEMFPNRDEFYSYSAFIDAAEEFPDFVGEGKNEVRKREAAAFLANVAHETTGGWANAPGGPEAWGLVFLEELDCESGCPQYCTPSNEAPCAPGKSYHGRGPIQLSHNYNYNSAGKALGVDLLARPELVVTEPVLSFRTAIWFWMNGIAGNANTPHEAMISKDGFGETIRIINSSECGGGAPAAVSDRVRFYEHFVDLLGVEPGGDLDC